MVQQQLYSYDCSYVTQLCYCLLLFAVGGRNYAKILCLCSFELNMGFLYFQNGLGEVIKRLLRILDREIRHRSNVPLVVNQSVET